MRTKWTIACLVMQFLVLDRVPRDTVFYFKTQKLDQSVYNLGKSFWLINEKCPYKMKDQKNEQ